MTVAVELSKCSIFPKLPSFYDKEKKPSAFKGKKSDEWWLFVYVGWVLFRVFLKDTVFYTQQVKWLYDTIEKDITLYQEYITRGGKEY